MGSVAVADVTPFCAHPQRVSLYRRTLADYRNNRNDLPLGDDLLPQPMDVCWLPCLDMTPPKQGECGLKVSLSSIDAQK